MHAQTRAELPPTPLGILPPRMRLLFITGQARTGGWLADALSRDGATEVDLQESIGATEGLECLRNDTFDAVLVSHEPGELNALDLLDAIRAGSHPDQPLIVLGDLPEHEMRILCYESGADCYVCAAVASTRELIWSVARAVERARLVSENQRLKQDQDQRRRLDSCEAGRILSEQRQLTEVGERSAVPLPVELTKHYGELLRAYIIMGAGRLDEELKQFVRLLVSSGVTARKALRLHLTVLEEMVQNLGARSARHVMNRTGLILLEVMLHVAETHERTSCDQREEAGCLPVAVGVDLDHPAD